MPLGRTRIAALVGLVLALLVAIVLTTRRPASVESSDGVTTLPAAPEGSTRGPRGQHRPPRSLPPRATPVVQARLATLSWGTGKDQAGKRHDPEGISEGPMAITAGRDGTLFLLDQVNGRVLRRRKDGSFDHPIAVANDTAQDLRVDDRGVTLLDRLGDKALHRYDSDGKLLDDRPLSAIGLREAGGATGLFEDASGELYVEESLKDEGRRVVHPAAGGAVLPGRPSADGRQLVTAAITSRNAGQLVVRGLDRGGNQLFETPLSVGRLIISIALLDTDDQGGIYAGVLSAGEAPPPSHDLVDERLDLFRLDASGQPIAHTSLDHPASVLETFRELCVAGVGVVWWMHPLPDGSGMVVDEIRL